MSRILLVILLGTIWGVSYTIARYAITHGVMPLGYAFWQSVGPAMLLLLLIFLSKMKFCLTWEYLRFYFFCGLVGIVLPNTNIYFVAMHLPAGLLAVLINTSAVMIYVLSLLAKVEKFSWQRLLAVALAVIAVMLIVVPPAGLPSKQMLPWVFMALISPFCFAVCAIYIVKCQPKGSNILGLSAGMLIVSSLLLTPVVFSTHSFYSLNWSTIATKIVLLEVLLSTVGYLLLFFILKYAGAIYYSLIGPVVVITGIIWGRVIFSEHLGFYILFAALLIILSLILVSRSGNY